jgi:hypothetical protein
MVITVIVSISETSAIFRESTPCNGTEDCHRMKQKLKTRPVRVSVAEMCWCGLPFRAEAKAACLASLAVLRLEVVR